MEYKLFDQPHSHDAEFYKDREMADHIHQDDHRPRLLQAIEEVMAGITPQDTICDFGCGNGGLLRELATRIPNKMYGYDMQPSNVDFAHQQGSPNVSFVDFINEPVEYPTIAVVTEVLEHLPDPHGFLRLLRDRGVKHIVASSPAYETESFHAPFHLWVWTGNSYADELFKPSGWEVEKAYDHASFHIVRAKSPTT